MASIDAIIFDLGNVLIPWNLRFLYRELFKGDESAMESFLSTIVSPGWNDTLDSDQSFAQGTAQLITRFPAQAELIQAYDQRWEEMLGEPIAENVSLLEELSGKGWPVFALSNWSKEKFPIARARFPFLNLFHDMVISGEVGVKKPDPAIFRIIIDRNRLEPAKTVFIDDTEVHCNAARELGFTAIQYQNPAQLRVELAKLGAP